MSLSQLPLTVPDLVLLDDLDPFANETTSDFQTLTQDIFHLLKELPGSNLDDPNRGVGIQQYLSGDAAKLANLQQTIDAQIKQDSRVTGCSTTIDQDSSGRFTLSINVAVSNEVLPLLFGFDNATFTLLRTS